MSDQDAIQDMEIMLGHFQQGDWQEVLKNAEQGRYNNALSKLCKAQKASNALSMVQNAQKVLGDWFKRQRGDASQSRGAWLFIAISCLIFFVSVFLSDNRG